MTEERILVVSPSFFGYERAIQETLRTAAGRAVDLVDERPSNTAFARALIRVSPRLQSRAITKHFRQALQVTYDRRYRLVLVIKGETTPAWFLAELRRTNPQARFVFYSFDSIRDSDNCLKIMQLFDRLYSFDQSDCARWPALQYKPLFFSEDFGKPRSPGEPREFDASFVGTLHSRRYNEVSRLTELLAPSRTRLFFYVQARWYFWALKLVGPFRGVPRRDVSFDKLSRAEVAQIFRSSTAVVDIQRSGQAGLTMRTFEVLAAGAGLITSNAAVRDEDFYDDSHILVVDPGRRDESARVQRFIADLEASEVSAPDMKAYSLAGWVGDFISEPVQRQGDAGAHSH